MLKALVIFLLVSSRTCEKIECKFDYQTHNVLEASLSLWACSTSVVLKGLQTVEISTEKVNETQAYINIQVFEFIDSEIDYIPIEIFKRFPDLIVLNASHATLPNLKENTFESKNELKVLDLSYNKIRQFSSFTGLSMLVVLDLSHNRIKKIDPLKNMPSLKILNLQNNEIIKIDANVFKNLLNLTKLKLSQNWILQIEEEFTGLGLLEELDLSENRIKKLTETSLTGLKNLKSLNIAENAITELDEKVFNDLVNLQFLYMQQNRLVAVCAELLKNLKDLQVLDASQNFIDHFDKQFFANQKKLKSLNLNKNTMTKIVDGAFENLEQLELLNIDVLWKFSEITNSTFKGLLNLKTLRFGNNLIDHIPTGAFNDLGKLQYLSMESTNQKKISADDLKPLKSLIKFEPAYKVEYISPFALKNLKDLALFNREYLPFKEDITLLGYSYLKKYEVASSEDSELIIKLKKHSCQPLHLRYLGNILTYSIEPEHFAVLSALSYPDTVQVLKLKNVRFNVDHHGIFKNQKVLKELQIKNSDLQNITKPLLAGLTNLQVLDLSKSKVSLIEDHSFDDLINLKFLNLKDNQIDFENTKLLTNLGKLEGIILNGNKMSKIDQEFVSRNILLKEIYLQSMQIKSIDDFSFQNLKELKILNLQWNKLMKLSHSVFHGLISLVTINLSENKLSSLSIEVFAHLKKLKEIDFTNNCCNYKNFDYFQNDLGLDGLNNSFADINCDQCDINLDAEMSNAIKCPANIDPTTKRSCKPSYDYSSFLVDYCEEFQRVGSQEFIECQNGYEVKENRSNHLTCLESGKWDELPITCKPICSSANDFKSSLNQTMELIVHLKHVPSQRVSLKDLNFEKVTIQHKYPNDNAFTTYTELSLPTGIKHLTIENSKFTSAQDFLSINQTQLEELYLNKNKIAKVKLSMLTGLTNLQIADFSGSQILKIEHNAFDDLKKLHTLKLNGNKIKFVHSKIFSRLVKLKYLFIHGSGNIMKTINKDLFKNTKLLKEIDMKSMLLEKIEAGAFRNLNKLQVLNLFANRISSLSESVFKGLESLTTLNLRNNVIKFLSPKTFSSMTKLSILDLWDNVCIYNNWGGTDILQNVEEVIANSTCIGCTVGDLGEFGRGVEYIFGKNHTIGDRVQNLQSLKIVCDPGYAFVRREKEDDVITCAENRWNKKFPLCISKSQLKA